MAAEFVLVLDTCAEPASLALVHKSGRLVAEEGLAPRAASTMLLTAVRAMLGRAGVEVKALAGVGVVNGPGSFTGIRVGLAFAKGLCEAAELPLAIVSRLEVLAEAGGNAALAVLSAGRDQVYARIASQGGASEWLLTDTAFREQRQGKAIVVDGAGTEARFTQDGPVRRVDLTAAHAVSQVLSALRQGGCDLARVDANYVRDEGAIYKRIGASPSAPSVGSR